VSLPGSHTPVLKLIPKSDVLVKKVVARRNIALAKETAQDGPEAAPRSPESGARASAPLGAPVTNASETWPFQNRLGAAREDYKRAVGSSRRTDRAAPVVARNVHSNHLCIPSPR